MVTMIGFSAYAVDLGQRDKQLAQAQHAIDSAVITAAQYLSQSGKTTDYSGANSMVKEVVKENLGIATAAWTSCTDSNALAITVAGDTPCISYAAITSPTGGNSYSIRVKLPSYTMDTIFGSIAGVNTINLAAIAASSGANCTAGTSGCSLGTTSTTTTTAVYKLATTTTTTIPATTTTLSNYDYCRNTYTIWDFAWSDDNNVASSYNKCKNYTPIDIGGWRRKFCTNVGSAVNIDGLPGKGSWTMTVIAHDEYSWHWTDHYRVCLSYVSQVSYNRGYWLQNGQCFTWTFSWDSKNWRFSWGWSQNDSIFTDWNLWRACEDVYPSDIDDFNGWWAAHPTTTTTAAPTTTAKATTTTAKATTTTTTTTTTTIPTSIDIAS